MAHSRLHGKLASLWRDGRCMAMIECDLIGYVRKERSRHTVAVGNRLKTQHARLKHR